jgi:hypothetical protein
MGLAARNTAETCSSGRPDRILNGGKRNERTDHDRTSGHVCGVSMVTIFRLEIQSANIIGPCAAAQITIQG